MANYANHELKTSRICNLNADFNIAGLKNKWANLAILLFFLHDYNHCFKFLVPYLPLLKLNFLPSWDLNCRLGVTSPEEDQYYN